MVAVCVRVSLIPATLPLPSPLYPSLHYNRVIGKSNAGRRAAARKEMANNTSLQTWRRRW